MKKPLLHVVSILDDIISKKFSGEKRSKYFFVPRFVKGQK
jgi:hypothetical protein